MPASAMCAALHSPGCDLKRQYRVLCPQIQGVGPTCSNERLFRLAVQCPATREVASSTGCSLSSSFFENNCFQESNSDAETSKAGKVSSLARKSRRYCVLTLLGVAGAGYGPDPDQPNLPGARRRQPLRMDTDPDIYLSKGYAKMLAEAVIREYFPKNTALNADMLRAVAQIESGYRPHTCRWEEALGEPSVGLMQTLLSTARWLASDMGYVAFGVPTLEALMDPWISLYFGTAYLDWLSTYGGRRQSLEFMIRAYNGGPGGANSSATLEYWRKYQACIASFAKL